MSFEGGGIPSKNDKLFSVGFLGLVTAFTLATASIGVEAFNDCTLWGGDDSVDTRNNAKKERDFFIAMIVITVLLFVAAAVVVGLRVSGRSRVGGVAGGLHKFVRGGGVFLQFGMLIIQFVCGVVGWNMINRCQDVSDESSPSSRRKDFFISITFLSLGAMGILATKKFFCKR